MEKIRGVIDMKLSIEDVTILNALIEKDNAKAVITDGSAYSKCPECNAYISESDNYCSKCGQKVDTSTSAL